MTTATTADFGGAGNAPPPKAGGGGGNWPTYGFTEKVKGKDKEGKPAVFDRRIPTWRLKVGEKDKGILLLDPPGPEHRYAVYIHDFIAPDGKFGSQLASIHRVDPAGDPMNDALGGDPSWFWAMTGIDLNKWTNPKNGKVYGPRRVLVLIRDKNKDQFLAMEKMGEGLRGRVFKVSRAEDKQSAKIGTAWDPIEKLADAAMASRYEKAAEEYGLPVDKFLTPFDYKTIFKPHSREKLLEIANAVRAHRESAKDVQVAEGDDESVPF